MHVCEGGRESVGVEGRALQAKKQILATGSPGNHTENSRGMGRMLTACATMSTAGQSNTSFCIKGRCSHFVLVPSSDYYIDGSGGSNGFSPMP